MRRFEATHLLTIRLPCCHTQRREVMFDPETGSAYLETEWIAAVPATWQLKSGEWLHSGVPSQASVDFEPLPIQVYDRRAVTNIAALEHSARALVMLVDSAAAQLRPLQHLAELKENARAISEAFGTVATAFPRDPAEPPFERLDLPLVDRLHLHVARILQAERELVGQSSGRLADFMKREVTLRVARLGCLTAEVEQPAQADA